MYKKIFVIITAFLILMLLTSVSSAHIDITSWGNNKTNNDSLTLTLTPTESINFNGTSDADSPLWRWFLDDINQSNNFNNFTTSFTGGSHTLTVNLTSANSTSNTVTWTITSSPLFQSVTISSSNIFQGQSTQITAWVTNVSNTTLVTALITTPTTTSTLSLSDSGSDLYVGTFSDTNAVGRHYVTSVTADTVANSYALTKLFTVKTQSVDTSSGYYSSTTSTLSDVSPSLPETTQSTQSTQSSQSSQEETTTEFIKTMINQLVQSIMNMFS